MLLQPITPQNALNPAFRKVKPFRKEIDDFKNNLSALISQVDNVKDEENLKTELRDFLKKTYYGEDYHFNVKDRIDWAIFNGPKSSDSVGVIMEAKRPSNKAEMITVDNLNRKAFHELMLYYLRERITKKNLEIKHLIITNVHEWFIFDVQAFEKLFAQNKVLVKQFEDFESKRLGSGNTAFFYDQIARNFLDELKDEITFTHIHLSHYEKLLRSEGQTSGTKLIHLYKVFSPEHLLKLPFVNDSNSLNKKFYAELLHIIGLEETKDGGKKVIGRKAKNQRNEGSLLENAIRQLDKRDLLYEVDKPTQYGASQEDQLFGVGLELVITWVNRVLFLKLLEAQMVAYHHDKSYSFLDFKHINNFDDLDSLFFDVLAKNYEERDEEANGKFGHVPYLNSSLFEPSKLEKATLFVSNLRDERDLPLISQTVLTDSNGKTRKGALSTIAYLFEFLNAYDFSSEGSEAIQEEKKTLINASVLGLIFEKINGYKDGSFFTPGFITMYMCRETIRRAVLEKFNSHYGWKLESIDVLYDKIEDKAQANTLINSIKICDPAVGSGHFLVSALNEMIAIKSELKILLDREGKTLRDYTVEVVNDELIVTNDDGEFFAYNPGSKESQRVQETLFHEKQTIIENCLFGVDINPNSVKICRLRLWIELLKSAYYKTSLQAQRGNRHKEEKETIAGAEIPLRPSDTSPKGGQLETLPNIDINIKTGNSLISRFGLDEDLSGILKSVKWDIDTYKGFVQDYKRAKGKEEKYGLEKLIEEIKKDFRTEIANNDPKIKRKSKLAGELFNLTQTGLFEESAGQKKKRLTQVVKKEKELNKLSAEIKEIKSNKIYENAFEWRFEFPEVLNDTGDFMGFDVVIGNPPYIRQEAFKEDKKHLLAHYQTAAGTADLFVYFIERGMNILTEGGQFVYILPNKWMRAGYGKNLRNWVDQFTINSIVDFGDLPVFEEATTYPCIWQMTKTESDEKTFQAVEIDSLDFEESLGQFVSDNHFAVNQNLLPENGWTLVNSSVQNLLQKLRNNGTALGEYVDGKIFYGIKTGFNEAFVIEEATKNQLIEEDPKSAEIIKPFLAGRDIKRYQQPKSDKFLIFTRRGINIENYPAILNYLNQFKTRLEPKPKDHKGDWSGRKPGSYQWFEIQDAVDYYEEFEKPKIIYPNICKQPEFLVDDKFQYTNQKCFIIPNGSKHLLGVLNSSTHFFLFKCILPMLRGGFFEPSYAYFKDFPIPEIENELIESKVDQILALKKEDPQANTSALEKEIDQMVYELYGLSEEEIGIVESSNT